MRTIAALELRKNLEQVIKRVQKGESLKVTYRSKIAFVIHPDFETSDNVKPGSQEAMAQYIEQAKAINKTPRQSTLDPHLSLKKLQNKILAKDPKYRDSDV